MPECQNVEKADIHRAEKCLLKHIFFPFDEAIPSGEELLVIVSGSEGRADGRADGNAFGTS